MQFLDSRQAVDRLIQALTESRLTLCSLLKVPSGLCRSSALHCFLESAILWESVFFLMSSADSNWNILLKAVLNLF